MTPLFGKIVKEVTLPLKRRTFVDQCGLLKRLDDVHCFEVTEVLETLLDLGRKLLSRGVLIDELGFLPAPKTWIEFKEPHNGHRCGFLLEQVPNKHAAIVRTAIERGDNRASLPYVGGLDLKADKLHGARIPVRIPGAGEGSDAVFASMLYAALAYINTPRIIGRRVHAPHAGIEKRLLERRDVVGKFPLHAWTEIILEVRLPNDETGEPSREVHYTGKRALHFVRAHLRICDGKLIVVSAHWRGDDAIGIVRSRYKVRKPKNGHVHPGEHLRPSP